MKTYARANRKVSTKAENLLWQELHGQKLNGFKFRQQHAISGFIVDFVCLSAKLIVKVDGEVHQEAEQVEYDTGRTHELRALGYAPLRFSHHQVVHALPQVLQTIRQQLELSSWKLPEVIR
ncbi:endonuclease domain-containing protein [uncultured Hymenobacter sp.]|uniref:endonuclease domain-containing protein n=1 Tax=uncultured Hymenobacter sp. TaxID=170016 RepID=UPI0035C95D33